MPPPRYVPPWIVPPEPLTLTYEQQHAIILADLHGKLYRQDWHGVMDCAADLRELEAREKGRREAREEAA